MTPSRLLIVSRVLPFHSAGGMQFVAWDLACALRELGAAVTVLTTKIPEAEPRFVIHGVEVVALQDAPPRRYGRRWWSGSRDFFGSRLDRVNAVLSVSAGAYGLLPLRTMRPDVRFVMQAHGTSAGEFVSKWRSRQPLQWLSSGRNLAWIPRDLRTYREFDRIVTVGEQVRRQFLRPPIRWFVAPDRVVTIENGVDTTRFRPDTGLRASLREFFREAFGWRPDDPVVCTASRLHPQKGVSEALNGFAAFVRGGDPVASRARYLILGDGEVRQDLQAQAARLAPDRVRLLGGVERERMPALLNASDLFLFTTRRVEGLPLNVLEAAAVGLPLVLSGALRGSFERFGSVRFVEPGDPEAIAAALEAGLAARDGDPGARVSCLPDRHALSATAARYAEVLFPQRVP